MFASNFIGAFESGRDGVAPGATWCLLRVAREKRACTTVYYLLQVDAVDVHSLFLNLFTVLRLTSREQIVKVGEGGWQAEVTVNRSNL